MGTGTDRIDRTNDAGSPAAESMLDRARREGRLEVLDWLAADPDRRPSPATLATLLRLGVRDLTAAGSTLGRDQSAAREATALLEALNGQPFPGDADAVVPLLTVVGAKVLADEPENAAQWAAAVTPVLDFLREAPRGAAWQFARLNDGHTDWREATGAQVLAEFLDAGRGPAYAHEMVTRAMAGGVAPDTFGYGPDIRPETFTALVEAGVTERQQLRAYLEAGLTIDEAVAMSADGVCAGAAVALRRDDIPVQQWVEIAAGLPEGWFPTVNRWHGPDPDPVAKGLRGRGFTWQDMRFLVDHGWSKLRVEEVDNGGFGLGRGRATGPLDPAVAVAAAAIIPLDKVVPWCANLTEGKRGRLERNDPALPPLLPPPWGDLLAQSLPAIGELTSLCVAPSHLGSFRKAGCRSVEDVATAVRAGITAGRARELVEAYGTRAYRTAPKRIADLRTLLALHRQSATSTDAAQA